MYPTVCTEASVMGVKVSEYRSGALIGSIYRDNMVVVTNETALGTQEMNTENTFSVYPNPADDKITINLSKDATASSLTILNILGEEVYTGIPKAGTTDIDISNFPKGIYLIRLQGEKGMTIRKVVKE